jgi:nucleoside triphosphate pyrophosphatase
MLRPGDDQAIDHARPEQVPQPLGDDRTRPADLGEPGGIARRDAKGRVSGHPLNHGRAAHRRTRGNLPGEGHFGRRRGLVREQFTQGRHRRLLDGLHNRAVYHSDVRLVLASASPRRRELLAAAGWAFETDAVGVDESPLDGEAPAAYVERVARLKAEAAAPRHPGRCVVAADTTVVVDGQMLGKPVDAVDAARMLRRLSGRPHDVFTAVAVAHRGRTVSTVERTRVWMSPLSEADIASYVATGEPIDKAGAYAIQGGAARFIPRIDGAYDTVVGLPMAAVLQLLKETRVIGGPDVGV